MKIHNIKQVTESFLDNLIPGEEATLSTYQAYRRDMDLFRGFLQKNEKITDICKVDASAIYDFKKYLYNEKNYMRSTVDRKMFCLKSFFQYADVCNYIDENPMNKIKYKKQQRRMITNYLTEEELDIICDTPHKMYIYGYEMRQALIYTLRYIGARRETIIKLNWNDVRFYNSTITLTIGKQVKPEQLTIVMHKRLVETLMTYYRRARPRYGDPIFISATGNRLSNTGYTKIIQEIVQASGLKKDFAITGHIFRHSLITILVQKGYTIADIQRITGQKDPRTLYEYYFKTNDKRMEEAITSLN